MQQCYIISTQAKGIQKLENLSKDEPSTGTQTTSYGRVSIQVNVDWLAKIQQSIILRYWNIDSDYLGSTKCNITFFKNNISTDIKK